MLSFTSPGSVVYENLFAPGDVVIAKETVKFCDGSYHRKGQEIVVTEYTASYFNVMHRDYVKKSGEIPDRE